jgi:hypothetical protein
MTMMNCQSKIRYVEEIIYSKLKTLAKTNVCGLLARTDCTQVRAVAKVHDRALKILQRLGWNDKASDKMQLTWSVDVKLIEQFFLRHSRFVCVCVCDFCLINLPFQSTAGRWNVLSVTFTSLIYCQKK